MLTKSACVLLGNLRRINEDGIEIDSQGILEQAKQPENYVFAKDAGKLLFENLNSLKGKKFKVAKRLLNKLWGK
jgi:hypothetical protein